MNLHTNDQPAPGGRNASDRHADEGDRSATMASAGTPTAADRSAVSPAASQVASAEPPNGLLPAAERLFGDRLRLAVRYADLLMTDAVVRGLIGPREAPRIWERHLLNCAALAELIPKNARVVDVGSGAGLPGLVLAIARPDLTVVLLEPLARRTAFLTETVTSLGLMGVSVVRARAEECAAASRAGKFALADIVTARALAPLDRLAQWCLPLTGPGGRVLALKGESVIEEIEAHGTAIARCGGGVPIVRRCGVQILDPPATVAEIPRLSDALKPAGRRSRRR